MEKEIVVSNIKHISRQRNLFLTLSLALSVTCAGLSLKLLTADQRIILVPGLEQEIWADSGGVSRSWLEKTAYEYLPYLLNLSGEDVNYNASRVFKHISQSDPAYLRKLQEYFVDVKDKYSKFNLITHFTTKDMETDSKKLSVTVRGTLTCIYGANGFELIPRSYKLTFEWKGGALRLKEFLRVLEKSEKEKDGGASITDFIKAVEKEKIK